MERQRNIAAWKAVAARWTCLVILVFWGCGGKYPPPALAPLTEIPPVPQEEPYRIGKGDILEVLTWKEQDFSREVPVRIDGRISFPLLEDIQAAGRTTLEVRNEIQEQLKAYIKQPVVSVAIKVAGSQRFYIIGEILKPGEYPLAKNLSVLQAFALAGGFTEWASKKEIILIRRESGEDNIIRVNYKNIVRGEDLEANVMLKADDLIVVP